MVFISDGVGFGGKNSPEDVKVIQWMIQTAQWFYGSKIFRQSYGIAESGNLDQPTANAIGDVIDCPKLFGTLNPVVPFGKKIIFPDDINYQFLIRCCIKPICTPCRDDNHIYLEDNSTARQAIQGRINFSTFRKIAENIAEENICRTLTKKGVEMWELLKSPAIKAFLDVIAIAEGADNSNDGNQTGYNTQGGSSGPAVKPSINNLSKHPGRAAMGRYQAIPSTWAQDSKVLGLYDFTPEAQDIFGTYKLSGRGMVADIQAGRIKEAIIKGSPEWASLPFDEDEKGKGLSYHTYSRGKHKGERQPVPYNFAELTGLYNDALRIYNSKKK